MGSKHGVEKLMENRDDAILVPLREKLEVYTTHTEYTCTFYS